MDRMYQKVNVSLVFPHFRSPKDCDAFGALGRRFDALTDAPFTAAVQPAAAAAVHGEEPSRTAGLVVPPTPRSAREEAKGWPLEKRRVLGPRWRSGLRYRQRSISTSHPSLCCLLASQKVSLCAGWFCKLWGFLFLMGGVTPSRGGGARSGAPPSARLIVVLACPPLGVFVSSCT